MGTAGKGTRSGVGIDEGAVAGGDASGASGSAGACARGWRSLSDVRLRLGNGLSLLRGAAGGGNSGESKTGDEPRWSIVAKEESGSGQRRGNAAKLLS